MAFGSLTFGSFGLKTSEDFTVAEDGTLKLNKLASYPIGSIYQSIDPTSPAELFGGVWESIASNRVLIGGGVNTRLVQKVAKRHTRTIMVLSMVCISE